MNELPLALTHAVTAKRLMRCKHCKAAQDSAQLMGYKCPSSFVQHSFTEEYEIVSVVAS